MRFRQKFFAMLVQINFLLTEFERHSAFAKRFKLHAEQVNVKGDAALFVFGGEDDVVEMIDHDLNNYVHQSARHYNDFFNALTGDKFLDVRMVARKGFDCFPCRVFRDRHVAA